ncbi:M16 family metallopeptidase [Desulfonatronum parangueonense]
MAQRPSPKDHYHQTQVATLANGLNVLVHEDDRFPLVAIRLFVRAGSAHELPEQAGISHMLEHMVFKGTSRRGKGRAASEIESAGGELNASTGFDATTYIIDLPAEHWALGLDVLQDMIFNATIDPDELESERQVILSEMEQGDDDPHRRIFKSIQGSIWVDSPYARPIIGYSETVRRITREDILDYIRDRYQPANMLLVLCGDIRMDQVLGQVEVLFGGLLNHGGTRSVASLPRTSVIRPPIVKVEQGPWQKAYVSLAIPIPGLQDVHSVGLDVLAQMLGGDRTSLLYRTFKYEQGIVDVISASATTLDQVGMFFIQARLDPQNITRLWTGLHELLGRLDVAAFPPEALNRAKLNMEDSLFQSKETFSGLASKLGHFQFHEHTFNAEQFYLHLVRTIDAEQLRDLIRTYIRTQGLVGSVFTPRPEELEAAELTRILEEKWSPQESPRAHVHSVATQAEREVIHLSPGRTLIMLPDASLPYTALSMTWNGGDLLLRPGEQGLSELTARVWTKGTRSKTAVQLQDFLADRAARLSAGAGLEHLHLNVHYPSRFSTEMLAFLQELIHEPAWAPEELVRAKQEQSAAIARTEDSAVGLAFRQTFPFLFPEHPYGYQRSGTSQGIEAIEREQVMSFWNRQKDRSWVLAVSGDYDRDAVRTFAETLARPDAMAAPAPPSPRWGMDREMLLQLKDRNQSHILVIFPVPGLGHGHTPGLNVLREVLAGQSGILFRELRDVQGLAYSVTAFLWQETHAGFMAFYIGTSPEKEAVAIQGFQDVVQHLFDNEQPESELERAKNLLWGDYQRNRQRLIVRSHETAEEIARGFEMDHSLKLIEQARRLTIQDLASLIQEYLQWDKAYLVKVQP